MSKLKQLLRRTGHQLGLNFGRAGNTLRNMPWFIAGAAAYRRENRDEAFALRLSQLHPQLHDRHDQAGRFDRHYFYQDLWAARAIYQARPERHVDVGSRLDGFIAHLLTFMPVTVVDVRPLDNVIDGLSFIREDATDMDGFSDDSVVSLSSLHAVEHFGLGRYGDPIGPDAWRRALASFARVLSPGGRLYLSLPVGRERVEFNAHRVFCPQTIIDSLDLKLLSFACVDDAGRFHAEATPADVAGCHYACGMFIFTKG